MGRLRPWDRSTKAKEQVELFISVACDIARRFLEAGYGVIIDDVITREELPIYREALLSQEGVHFVVLLPDLDVVLERKGVDPRQRDRLTQLHKGFMEWDSVSVVRPAGLAPALVADRVMALAGEGASLMSSPTGA